MPRGNVRVSITADADGVRRATTRASTDIARFGDKSSKSLDRLKTAALAAGAALGTGLVAGGKKAFTEFQDAEKVARQTEAVLKSTGKAAGVSARQIEQLANALSLKAGVDDEAIQKSENLLLTFTRVQDQAGKGNKVFSDATRVILDMSAAMDQDLKSSTIQVGKALNDPIKGLTSLQRVGVQFTESQRKRIEGWVAEGKTLKAQKLILGELTREFGGSAAAQATSTAKLKVAVDNLFESIGKTFGPALENAAAKAARFINQMQTGAGAGGRFAKQLKQIWSEARPVVVQFGKAAAAAARFAAEHPGIVKVATAVGLTAIAFNKFRIGAAVRAVAGFVKAASAAPGNVRDALSGVRAVARRIMGQAGTAGGTELATQAADTVGSTAPGKINSKSGRLKSAASKTFRGVGRAAGVGMVAGVVLGLAGLQDAVIDALRGIKDKVDAWAEQNFGKAGTVAGDVRDFIGGNIPHGLPGSEVLRGVFGRRTGGLLAGAGMVPAVLSPGEVGVTPDGGAFRVPGPRTAADTAPMLLPPGTAVLTSSGQRIARQTGSITEALARQAPHFQAGGVARASGGGGISSTGQWARALLDRLGIRRSATAVYDLKQWAAIEGGHWHNSAHYNPLNTSMDMPGATSMNSHGVKAYRSWAQGLSATVNTLRLSSYRAILGALRRGTFAQFRSAVLASPWGTTSIPGGPGPKPGTGLEPSRGSSYTRVTPAPVSHPLLGNMLAPLVDDALLGGIEAGIEGTGRRGLLTEVLEGIVPDPGDRATRERITVSGRRAAAGRGRGGGASGPIASRLRAGLGWLSRTTHRGLPYQYGGGHGTIGVGSPSFDCSGLVSGGLHAMGLLDSPLTTVGLMGWGRPGKGRNVTVGVRGGAGRTGHTMMAVNDRGRWRYFESGGAGVGERSGWSGAFTSWRHPAWRKGGIVGLRRGGMVAPSPEGRRHLEQLTRRKRLPVAALLDPKSAQFVGWGMRTGGILDAPVGGFGFGRGRKRQLSVGEIVALIGQDGIGSPKADRLIRQLSGRMSASTLSQLLAAQRRARTQIRRMARDGFTGPERIRSRRLQGAITLLQDQMGRPIGRAIGATDRVLERIDRSESRIQDELIVGGIDPQSDRGLAAQRDLAARSLAQLAARRARLQKQLARAKRTRNKKAVRQVAGKLREVDDRMLGLRSSIEQLEPEPVSPFRDVDMQSALASLTPGTEDDLAAARERQRIAEGGLWAAVAYGAGPETVTEWANNVKAARDAVESLTGELAENNRRLEELASLQKEANQIEQTKVSLAKEQGPALLLALAGISNGWIGGNAGLGRSFPSFAGLGGLART